MKCFHFISGDRRTDDDDGVLSRSSTRVSWARSLSVASTSFDTTRRSEFDLSSNSRDLGDSEAFSELLSQRRANDLRVFKFAELKAATKGFNRSLVIGEGGFGCVYRGVVKAAVSDEGSDGDRCLDVAIKQLSRNGFQGHKEWINEVNFLGVVNHPNLVKLVGYCAEDDERGIQRLLVYELMRNKSLEHHLLGRGESPLSWMVRLQIAQGAARGLAYLHEEMDFQLIFRDFKTSNILLDEDFNPKLSDFGLARQGPAAGLSHVSTVVVGTIGYAAPEYLHTGRLTSKSDVWSFGVVLYELITGRRAVERNLPRNEQKLLEWVKPYISDSKKFHLLLDPRLEGDYSLKSAHKLSCLANKCLTKNPKSRPKMSEVVEMLGKIINDTSPPQPETESQLVTTEEPEEAAVETDSGKQEVSANNYMKKVFDFKELVTLRNRSILRMEWRHWPPGMVRHSA
ncbi:serine/threonine-protein kinase PCRK1-like [Cynara cardunculus var. scolymus]|uniref:serine/threonine-protein kinase PCRK1-like n=1 Tax=Cynara cardunculus var. scolymus TaxID=59895 RepID=UPI000D62D485|nr:serine/threonine-protein kinase PCRK1-like [Cynara cardunculus var. scolymus]